MKRYFSILFLFFSLQLIGQYQSDTLFMNDGTIVPCKIDEIIYISDILYVYALDSTDKPAFDIYSLYDVNYFSDNVHPIDITRYNLIKNCYKDTLILNNQDTILGKIESDWAGKVQIRTFNKNYTIRFNEYTQVRKTKKNSNICDKLDCIVGINKDTIPTFYNSMVIGEFEGHTGLESRARKCHDGYVYRFWKKSQKERDKIFFEDMEYYSILMGCQAPDLESDTVVLKNGLEIVCKINHTHYDALSVDYWDEQGAIQSREIPQEAILKRYDTFTTEDSLWNEIDKQFYRDTICLKNGTQLIGRLLENQASFVKVRYFDPYNQLSFKIIPKKDFLTHKIYEDACHTLKCAVHAEKYYEEEEIIHHLNKLEVPPPYAYGVEILSKTKFHNFKMDSILQDSLWQLWRSYDCSYHYLFEKISSVT